MAKKAAIYHSKLTQAVATIKDITADEPALDLVGEIDTSGEDSIKFIQNSPLHKDIDVGKGKIRS
ncbi:MAG: DUF3971 domain-containing protein [Thiotrichaceae bacterium]